LSEFDDLADCYDATRGGERRGDEYAADIDLLVPKGAGPILEIGVGTGVVALGLRQRGRTVIGLDISSPMLKKAWSRLGPTLIRADATAMSLASASVAHAVSVWVVHSVKEPKSLFHEAARVIRPGGKYVVCQVQRPASDDAVGQIIREMCEGVDERRGAARPRGVSTDEVVGWASTAGFSAQVHEFERHWLSTPGDELRAIELRAWPAMRELDEIAIDEVTRPAIVALKALPETDQIRRSTVEAIVFERP